MADINGKIIPSQQLNPKVNTTAPNINSNVDTETEKLASGAETGIDVNGTINAVGAVNPEEVNSVGNLHGELINDVPSGYGYVYIRYSHEYPTQDSDMLLVPDEDTKYMGVLGLNSPFPPTSYTRYQWSLIRGYDGEKGDKGDKGDKGESGDAEITIVNGFLITGQLNVEGWQLDVSRDKSFYSQRIEITEPLLQVIEQTLTAREPNIGSGTIYNTYEDVINSMSPVVDLIVSSNIQTGQNEIENWKFISRAYLMREDYIDDTYGYYICFECYNDRPSVLLRFQMKVI